MRNAKVGSFKRLIKLTNLHQYLLKGIGRGRRREKITNIRYKRAVIKANPMDITKTIARYYYELYANEMEKVEEMNKSQSYIIKM